MGSICETCSCSALALDQEVTEFRFAGDGTMTEPIIRTFVATDMPRLEEITLEAFDGVSIDRNIEEAFGPIGERDWRFRKWRQIEEDLRRQADGVFVAELETIPVGYVTTWVDVPAGMGFIPNLAVDRSCRGSGLGRKLLLTALRFFQERGLTHARIETLTQNAIGQNLYPSLGFREIAQQIHYCMPLDQLKD